MIGPFLALLTSILFALNDIFIRRAVLNVSDASLGTLISVPMSIPFYFLILVFTGEVRSVLSFTWQGYMWLSLAGIFFFVIGRSLSYQCIQIVGANITGNLRRTNILVSVLIGVALLHEPFSWQFAFGVIFIIIGISLVGFSSQSFQTSHGRFSKIPPKAFLFGFGSGVAWGLGPIFVKLGLRDSGSPISGLFVSFLAATAMVSISLINPKRRAQLARITGRATLFFFLGGLISCIANFFRYLALGLSPASVVTPLVATSPIFVLILSFIYNRNLEIFTRPVIFGTLTVAIGTVLLV